MARKRKDWAIEHRRDAQGNLRHRANPMVDGRRPGGHWTADLDEAIAERDRLVRDAQTGLLADRKLKLGTAISEFGEGIQGGWIVSKTGHPYGPATIRLYTAKLKLAADKFGRGTALDAMRVPHVYRYVSELRRERVSDSEIHNIVTALRAMFRWALLEGHAVINPCVGIPLPGGDRRVRRIAPTGECRLLTAAVVGRDRTAFACAWLAGLRAEELLALAWPDNGLAQCNVVDLDAGVLRIETAVDTTTREWLPATKTYAGRRDVMIRDQLAAILDDHGEEYGRSGLLFPADRIKRPSLVRSETPMAYTSLIQRLHKRWAAAGLEKLDLHEGRHTFVSMLIANGANDVEVTEEVGHASASFTKDRYGHLFKRDRDELLRRMNEYDQRLEFDD